MIDGDYYRNDIQLLYLFFFLIPHRCCRLHTRCHSTPQRHSSPCWVVWRWMTRRLQRQRCRSSRTQAARWKRVSLTSNRMFHRPIDTWSRACAITLFHQAFKKEKKKKNCGCSYFGRRHLLWACWILHGLWQCFLWFVMVLLCVLPLVCCCRYYRPKPRGAPLARPSMPSTASMPCSPTETRTSPRSLRSVSHITLVLNFLTHKRWIYRKCKLNHAN